MNETQVRDLLISNLHILDLGYKFLDKETYLPSEIGTRSFIDILACDENGKYIIIEVKKSNAVARQAIHELFKYLEAVKENLAVKTDEIELIVASTEWDELLVPFSSFVSNVNLKTRGFKLFINNNEISSKEINTNVLNEERVLSSIQMANYYYSIESLEKGIKGHIDYFTKRGIESFALLILKSPENYKELVMNSISGSEIQEFIEINDFAKRIDYKYIIYSVNQLVSIEKYKDICLKYFSDSEIDEDIQEILDNEEATLYDKMEHFNHLILEQEPFPESDFTEIGTPAKYNKFIEVEGWELLEIKRFGALNENKFLTDDLIEQEVKASGTTGERYISEIDMNNVASISRVKREISNCLSDNIVWRNHILEIIDSLYTEKSKIKNVRCSIYNPMNIIYSIYLICSDSMGILYIPSYQIEVELDGESRMYIGYLDGDFKNVSMNEVLAKFWNSSVFEFFMTLNWGGYFKNNLEVCEFIGLDYKTMLIKKKDESIQFFNYKNYRFIESNHFDYLDNTFRMLTENELLVPGILSFFDSHNAGNGIWEV
jgi:hypothetical protein